MRSWLLPTNTQTALMLLRQMRATRVRAAVRYATSDSTPPTPGTVPQMLEGHTVLELAGVLAGPTVGQFLAELGATVIKVENTTTLGDVTRTWKVSSEAGGGDVATDRPSSYFSSCNLGKRSLAVDLRNDEGRAIVHELAARSSVVLTSYKAGDAEKLGVDYDTLREIRRQYQIEQGHGDVDKMVYAHITGYGTTDSRPGYDAVIQAEAGFAAINGEPPERGGGPCKMPVALMDLLAAHQLKEAVLLHLWHAHASPAGRGGYISVSLMSAAVSALANQATSYLQAGVVPQRIGSEHPSVVPYGTVFETADGKPLVLAIGTSKQFETLCDVLGEASLAADERFGSNHARVVHRDQLKAELSRLVNQYPSRPALLEALANRNVPAGAVNDMSDVFTQPQAGALVVRHARDGAELSSSTAACMETTAGVRQVAFASSPSSSESVPDGAADTSIWGRAYLSAPPLFGEHTGHVLCDILGKTEAEVRRLEACGVVSASTAQRPLSK